MEDWRYGTVVARKLEDGRVLTVTPMTFGKYRLNVGNEFGYEDGW
jgi:hypothetical protein